MNIAIFESRSFPIYADRRCRRSLARPRAESLRTPHPVISLPVGRGLRIRELELAGAGGRFGGETDLRPVAHRQAEVRAGQHGEHGVGEVGEIDGGGPLLVCRAKQDLWRGEFVRHDLEMGEDPACRRKLHRAVVRHGDSHGESVAIVLGPGAKGQAGLL